MPGKHATKRGIMMIGIPLLPSFLPGHDQPGNTPGVAVPYLFQHSIRKRDHFDYQIRFILRDFRTRLLACRLVIHYYIQLIQLRGNYVSQFRLILQSVIHSYCMFTNRWCNQSYAQLAICLWSRNVSRLLRLIAILPEVSPYGSLIIARTRKLNATTWKWMGNYDESRMYVCILDLNARAIS